MGSPRIRPLALALLLGITPVAVATGAPLLPERAAAAAVTVDFSAPDSATLGDLVQVVADGGPGATYEWDLDGDGTFEVDGGSDPATAFGFSQAGSRSVAVRVTGADGSTSTRTASVDVLRPTTATLVLDPPDPAPGDLVKATVLTRTDDPGGVAAYVWDVEGVQARDGSATLDKPGERVPGQVLDLGAGRDVTTKPSFSFRMPSGRGNLGRSVDLSVAVVDGSGSKLTVERSVILEKPVQGSGQDPYTGKTVDCNDPQSSKVPAWPCAAISYTGVAVADVGLVFRDASPTVEVCYQEVTQNAGGGIPRLEITELKELGYPAPEAIALGGDLVSTPGARTTRTAQDEPRDGSARIDSKEKCIDKGALTQKWEWGDGTTSDGGIGESGNKGFVYVHAYDEPGTYEVTLHTRVPYLVTKSGTSGTKGSFTQLKYFNATRTTTVDVEPSVCGPVLLNQVPVTVDLPLSDMAGCFGIQRSTDGTHDVYLPAGPLLLNGIAIEGAAIVDPVTATISSPGGTLTAKLSSFEGGAVAVSRQVVAPTPVIQVPPPAPDAQAGGVYASLPAVPVDPTLPANTVKGLGVTAVQALLSPTGKPLVRLYTKLPSPLNGETAPLILTNTRPQARYPAGPAARGSIPGVETDFEIDLGGVDMGAFRINKGVLAHRTTGGWVGEVDLDVAGLGNFAAPYIPDTGTSSGKCSETTGPSGIELSDSGDFVFGGARATFAPALTLGPLGLTCLAIKGKAEPLTLEGKAAADFPAGSGFVTIDACLAMAVLRAGQTGVGCDSSAKPTQDAVWFRAQGQVGLADVVTLGRGYAEVLAGSGYQSAKVGGEVTIDKSIFFGKAFVDGQMVFSPQFAYSLIGGIELCADLVIDFCADAQAGVSSKGFGACISVGGAVYLKGSGWKVFFASCDLKSYLSVARTVERRRAGTSAVATMPPGTSKAAFVVHRVGAGAPPTLRLTGPGGAVTTDDGRSYQEKPDGTVITKFVEEGVTTITVQGPAAGQWTVAAEPELVGCSPRGGCSYQTPDISLDLQTPIPEPEVTGTVVGTGRERTLQYAADLDAGDELVLVEEGSLGTRLLGSVPARDSASFTIPTAGSAEPRTITAIIERNGIPYREITLASYQAPSAVGLSLPAGLEVVAQGSEAEATWEPVPGARGYEVVADLGDGRVVRVLTDGPSAVLPGVTAFTPGTVRVRALGEVGLDSGARSTTLTPLTRVRVRW